MLLAVGLLFAVALVGLSLRMNSAPREITQKDIDAAVQHTLETVPMPAMAALAYDAVRPSVVRVIGLGPGAPDDAHKSFDPFNDKSGPKDGKANGKSANKDRAGKGAAKVPDKSAGKGKDKDGKPQGHGGVGVGTGVVIVDKGVILTNLHVVSGAERIKLVFDDGTESDAVVIGARPEHDLAVLQAKTIPDDLVAATLRSTADLAIGDHVVAVGFPFGIGPSASAGVVSGLRREYTSPEGKRIISNLIQFDAAANPGNSGGPLVTAGGEVVGIVTGILNPTEQRVFIGIGFAVPIENAAAAVGMSPF